MRLLRWALASAVVALFLSPGLLAQAPAVPAAPAPSGAANPSLAGAAAAPRAGPSLASPSGSASDAWANWTNVSGGPPERDSAQSVYDAAMNATILFGGRSPDGAALNDTWAFAHGVWRNLTETVSPSPPARWGAGIAYDADLGEIVLFGGRNATAFFADTWVLANGTWHPAPTLRAPSARTTSLAYDSRSDDLYLYGGAFENLSASPPRWTYYNDTWLFRSTAWLNETASSAPGPNATGTLVYDAGDHYLVLIGGAPSHNHLWAYSKGRWHLVAAGPPPPTAGANSTVAFDSEGGFVLLVAPAASAGGTVSTWAYRANLWTNLTANLSIAPPARTNATLVDDPLDGVTLLLDGDAGSPVLNESWAFLGVPFHLGFLDAPNATDAGLAVNLTDVLTETTGSGFAYTYQYGGLPLGCASTNFSAITCAALTSGSYALNTTVTRSDGAVEVATTRLDVHDAPTAYLDAPLTVGDPGQNFSFSGSVGSGTGPYRYAWSFDDGTNATGANATHAFGRAGTYVVELAVTDAVGDVANASVLVTVHPGLGLELASNRSATDTGLPVGFVATPINGTGPYRVAWSFPGGGTAAGTAASFTFLSAGNFTVNATVTDAAGRSAMSQLRLTVEPAPSVRITESAERTDVAASIAFSALPTGGVGAFSFLWLFSDGSTANGSSTAHAFGVPGPAWAKVTAVDAAGALASATVNVSIAPRPTITASITSGGCGPPLNLSVGASVTGGLAPYSVLWSFGDGSPSVAANATTHVYAAYGRYTIWANVTDAAGESSTSTIAYAPAACPTPVRGPTGSGNASGIPESGWFVLAGLVAAVLVAGVALGLRRRRAPPAAPASPGAGAAAAPAALADRPDWSEDA